MKPLSREAIERMLGKQPPLPEIPKGKPRGVWSAIGKEEANKIVTFAKKNKTHSYKELSKIFGRSSSAICALLKREGVR